MTEPSHASRQRPRATHGGVSPAAALAHLPPVENIGDRNGRQAFAAAQTIYVHSAAGKAWRVLSGSVRLDRFAPEGDQNFANLALKGDVIGAETLLFGHYSFTATALTPCLLAAWPEGCSTPAGESLLHSMATAERRAADVIALRCGQAADRVRRLIMMLAQRPDEGSNEPAPELKVVLPARQDMADITALTLETVSRMVSRLRHCGMLDPVVRRGHESNSRFVVRA